MTVETAGAPAIEVRDLTVRAGGRSLLDRANLSVPAGELAILAGGSGTGKSVLLKILAGLAREDPGVLSIEGEVRTTGRVGMVFQQGALFEELCALENVAFALDHSPDPSDRDARARALLEEVLVPPELAPHAASGGERRRVAIARALANRPEILLYDEPTAGLDPDLALRIARSIREAHERHRTTTLIVTHDFASLASVADRILFLDPKSATLREVGATELDRLVAEGAFRAEAALGISAGPGSRSVAGRVETLGRGFAAFAGAAASGLLPRWRRARWGLRALLAMLRLVGGPTSVAYVSLAGAVTGFVAVYFSFQYLPYAGYLRPLVTEDLLGAIGFALYRILVPVLATTLVAARCGAAVASDLAGRSYREELDALRTLGASPGGIHGFAGLASLAIATPFLVLVAFLVARATALATFALWDEDVSIGWITVTFHSVLRGEAPLYAGTGWVLAKSLACGLAVGWVAIGFGLGPKRAPADVSRAVTQTVLFSTALVLLVHFAFAFVEF
ncbi:MAG: ABC transporter permease [Planctomycetes bacterium]|nr:ABC transporter permease [Planctomycetota bacterium]